MLVARISDGNKAGNVSTARRGSLMITEIHPNQTPVGAGFNIQEYGSSVIGVAGNNASPQTTVIFNGEPLDTDFRDGTYVTARVPDRLFSVEGIYEVYLLK